MLSRGARCHEQHRVYFVSSPTECHHHYCLVQWDLKPIWVIWLLTSWLDNDLHARCRVGISTNQDMEHRKRHSLHLEERIWIVQYVLSQLSPISKINGIEFLKTIAPSKCAWWSRYKYFRRFEECMMLLKTYYRPCDELFLGWLSVRLWCWVGGRCFMGELFMLLCRNIYVVETQLCRHGKDLNAG